MNEIVNIQHVERILQILAITCPFAGLAVGTTAGCIRKRRAHCMVSGLLAGLVATAVFGLWRIFLLLGKPTGFAGVGFISGQIVLFLGIGLAAGAVIGRKTAASAARAQSFSNVKSKQEDKLNG
jgi:hypothetical protein